MNPFNLPSNTEYSFPHSHQPHPYLWTSTGTMRPPIKPDVPLETNFQLSELQVRNETLQPNSTKPNRSKRSQRY